MIIYVVYSCTVTSISKNCPSFLMITLHRKYNETHHYNTRNANKLDVRYGRTNYTEHAISNKGVITWNILDNSQYYVSFNL